MSVIFGGRCPVSEISVLQVGSCCSLSSGAERDSSDNAYETALSSNIVSICRQRSGSANAGGSGSAGSSKSSRPPLERHRGSYNSNRFNSSSSISNFLFLTDHSFRSAETSNRRFWIRMLPRRHSLLITERRLPHSSGRAVMASAVV